MTGGLFGTSYDFICMYVRASRRELDYGARVHLHVSWLVRLGVQVWGTDDAAEFGTEWGREPTYHLIWRETERKLLGL